MRSWLPSGATATNGPARRARLVTARYLRYEFDIATSQITDGAVHYVCVDEIDVRTEADTPEPPPVVDPDPGDCVNLAAGRPYTSAWAASGSYADDGGQLTDGVYSRALSWQSAGMGRLLQ